MGSHAWLVTEGVVFFGDEVSALCEEYSDRSSRVRRGEFVSPKQGIS